MCEVRESALRYVPTPGLSLDWLLGAFQPWLDREELSRLSRLRRVEDKRDYVAAHALLRFLVGDRKAMWEPTQRETFEVTGSG